MDMKELSISCWCRYLSVQMYTAVYRCSIILYSIVQCAGDLTNTAYTHFNSQCRVDFRGVSIYMRKVTV